MATAYSAMQGWKNGIITAAGTMGFGTNVWVGRGFPGFDPWDDLISIGTTTTERNRVTYSRSLQTIEETLTLELIIYAFRAGGVEQEDVVDARANAILSAFELYGRSTDTSWGTSATSTPIRESMLTSAVSAAATDPSVLSKGRMQVLSATFTAHARITL